MQEIGAAVVDNQGRESDNNVGAEEQDSWMLDLLVVVVQHKGLILAITLCLTAIAAISVYSMRDSFRAQAVILPPQQQQSSLAGFATGPLGSLAGSGLGAQLGLKNPGDLYIGILKSRTVSDAIVSKFHLQEIYKRRFLSDARRELSKNVTLVTGKDSLIVISVEDYDPKRATAMANAFVDQLYFQNSRLAMTDAAQRRLFFEQRLRREKDTLIEAEVELQKVQTSTGLLLPGGQAEVLLRSTAQIRAEISSREVTLEAMRSFATDENTQVQNLRSEISALRAQLATLESKGGQRPSFEISVGKLPAASLEYIRKLREVKYHETLYELLAKQYESAQMDEAKQAPLLQVVDRATLPDKKSGPPRVQMVLGAGLLAAVLTSASVFAFQSIKSNSGGSGQARGLASLRSAIRSGG